LIVVLNWQLHRQIGDRIRKTRFESDPSSSLNIRRGKNGQSSPDNLDKTIAEMGDES
jgi:hypothetical protein